MMGCLRNLYDSIEILGDSYMQSTSNKDILLNPMVSSNSANVPLLLPNMQPSTFIDLYSCSYNEDEDCDMYEANDPNSVCPSCHNVIDQKVTLVNPANKASSSSEGGYVKGVVTCMIMDDMAVRPMSTISSITLLNKFNVKDVGVLQEKVIAMGMDEGVKLLRASLQSKEVLTDVRLRKNLAK